MRLTTNADRLMVTIPRSPAWSIAFVCAMLLLVAALDRVTGAAPVQHLYYVPIIVSGLRFQRPGGVIAALISILLYHLANPHLLTFRYGEQDLIQIVLFVAVGMVTATLSRNGDRLRQLALTDDLTGLHNLRSFEAHLATMVRASRRSQAPIALLVLDVDRLKSLNDQYGHLTGAEAVRTIGHTIGQELPPMAIACRYGGDEFAIVLPACPVAAARTIAERLCAVVQASAPVLAGRQFPAGTLSVSVGGTCAVIADLAPASNPTLDADAGEGLFRAADAALYRAKASGSQSRLGGGSRNISRPGVDVTGPRTTSAPVTR